MLRYPGGKWKIAPWIISHFPPHQFYVEPFGGGASVLLRKRRSHLEIYNDIDSDVVNVFRVIRDRVAVEKLKEMLRFTPYSREEYERAYEECEDPIEKARRMIVRSFQGFGNTGTTRKSTGFRAGDRRDRGLSAPQQWKEYPDLLDGFARRLQGVTLENRPALDVIKQNDSVGTLFYVDPPYVHSTRSDRGIRYSTELLDCDHIELAHLLNKLDGMVLLSGYRCDLYDDLYSDWACVSKNTIASGQNGGIRRTESLWISPKGEEANLPLFGVLND